MLPMTQGSRRSRVRLTRVILRAAAGSTDLMYCCQPAAAKQPGEFIDRSLRCSIVRSRSVIIRTAASRYNTRLHHASINHGLWVDLTHSFHLPSSPSCAANKLGRITVKGMAVKFSKLSHHHCCCGKHSPLKHNSFARSRWTINGSSWAK